MLLYYTCYHCQRNSIHVKIIIILRHPRQQIRIREVSFKIATIKNPNGYIVVKTTANCRPGKYYRYALSTCELWSLCCLLIGIHLTTAVGLGRDETNNNIGAQQLTTIKQSGTTAHQHLLAILATNSDSYNNRIDQQFNERPNTITTHRCVQTHLKRFTKIRTNIGTNELDTRKIRDVSEITNAHLLNNNSNREEDVEEESVTTLSPPTSSTIATSTSSKVSILQPPVATPVANQDLPMSPVHPTTMDTMGSNVVVFVLVLALVLATLGVLTCILSTYRYRSGGGGGGHHMGGRARTTWPHPTTDLPSDTPGLLGSNANLPMLALPGGMCDDRMNHDMAALRDRHVRLKSVQTDMELDLPPNIRLPDGEELPYGCSTRLHIRDPEQESEIYQKCVRPPPNRTVFDGESPPPYRSSSAGLLSHSTSSSVDWSADGSDKVIRCHSMSSGSPHAPPTPPPPPIIVPTRSRRLSAFTDTAATRSGVLSQLTMVSCHAERQRRPTPPSRDSV